MRLETRHRIGGDGYSARRPDVSQQSIMDLLKRLRDDALRLVRTEFELAKVEIQENLKGLLRNAILMAVGGALLLLAGFALVAAMSIALTGVLAAVMPIIWAGAVATTGVCVLLIAAGLICLAIGRARLRKKSLAPDATVETLKEDKEWILKKVT